ncbi:MAG: thioredoxin domain-containing protein [Deltaproteobacteria bacterium]|nr:thioredoxin domain-containing protein [Deltaproteobacteria bacterium]
MSLRQISTLVAAVASVVATSCATDLADPSMGAQPETGARPEALASPPEGCGRADAGQGCKGECGAVAPTPGAPELAAAIPLLDSPRRGGSHPQVTVVFSSDFECQFCARVGGVLDRVLAAYGDKVAVVFKHNPMPFHAHALEAALAAEAAGRQGKFWEMVALLFANQQALDRDHYLQWARALGLDVARFAADLELPELRERVQRDQELVKALGGRGVPNFWVNGRHLVGAQPFEVLKGLIDAELEG